MLRLALHSALTLALAAPATRPEGPDPAPTAALPQPVPRRDLLVAGGLTSLAFASVALGLAIGGALVVADARRDVAATLRPYDVPPRIPDARAIAELDRHNAAGALGDRYLLAGAITAGVFAVIGAALLARAAVLRRRARPPGTLASRSGLAHHL